ncbi:hypothetical protein M0804_010334 [Polistes exclamans]|nr:hypothetical protein M0804_010334 [Polistes exclamans]
MSFLRLGDGGDDGGVVALLNYQEPRRLVVLQEECERSTNEAIGFKATSGLANEPAVVRPKSTWLVGWLVGCLVSCLAC